MQANDVNPERLRRLAETRPAGAKVLSVFLNLDPREFATAPARATELRSVLDRAARLVREHEGLSHAERASLEGDLKRLEADLGGGLDAKGAHGLAAYTASAAGLFEVLKLAEPVDHEPVVADAPFVEPLAGLGTSGTWCVVLVNRRTARLFCGTVDSLEETALVEDEVRGQHDQGGWSQARYQRSVDKDVADHLKHAASVAFATMRGRPPEGLLVGAPQELAGDFEAALHPYLRERLAGRLEIDVEHASPDEVRAAAAPHIEAARHRLEDDALARLAEGFGSAGRAAGGLAGVLRALHEQRVEALLLDHGFAAPGVVCPTCGWLAEAGAERCPADDTPTEPHVNVVEAAVQRALTQAATVHVLRDRPELASHGHVAAILRF